MQTKSKKKYLLNVSIKYLIRFCLRIYIFCYESVLIVIYNKIKNHHFFSGFLFLNTAMGFIDFVSHSQSSVFSAYCPIILTFLE